MVAPQLPTGNIQARMSTQGVSKKYKPIYIYALLHRPTKTCYVGSSYNPKDRFWSHMKATRQGHPGPQYDWMRELRKAGIQPELVILQKCANQDEAGKEEYSAMTRAKHAKWTVTNGSGTANVKSRDYSLHDFA